MSKVKLKEEKETARHWYEVIFRYTPDRNNGGLNSFRRFQIGVEDQSDTLNRRSLKLTDRQFAKGFCKNAAQALRKSNGTLDLEIVCYLGYFSKKAQLAALEANNE